MQKPKEGVFCNYLTLNILLLVAVRHLNIRWAFAV